MACAIEAQKNGLSYIVIEKGTLVNSLYNYPVFMTFFSTSERLEIGDVPFVNVAKQPNRNEALEYYRRVASAFSLNIKLFELVNDVKKTGDLFSVTTDKSLYSAKNVVVATGFYDIPVMMRIPGEDLPKVTHYYKDPHLYAFSKLVVIGANNSAVDVALEAYRKGADVTLVVRGDGFGSVKYWVLPDVENRIKEGSIKAYFNSEVVEITQHHVKINTTEGLQVIENDFVAAMTGYRPNFELLQHFGVALNEVCQPQFDAETMETNIPNLYLAGVVCGGLDTRKWFIENSRVHAGQIVSDILSKIDNIGA